MILKKLVKSYIHRIYGILSVSPLFPPPSRLIYINVTKGSHQTPVKLSSLAVLQLSTAALFNQPTTLCSFYCAALDSKSFSDC